MYLIIFKLSSTRKNKPKESEINSCLLEPGKAYATPCNVQFTVELINKIQTHSLIVVAVLFTRSAFGHHVKTCKCG